MSSSNGARPRPAALDPNQLYDVKEAGAALAICQASVYELFESGDLARVKVGARTRVNGAELIALKNRIVAGEVIAALATTRATRRRMREAVA